MRDVIDYWILESAQAYYLDKEVKLAIAEGWQPLGGVSVCLYASSGNSFESKKVYSQAMVKYKPEKTKSIIGI